MLTLKKGPLLHPHTISIMQTLSFQQYLNNKKPDGDKDDSLGHDFGAADISRIFRRGRRQSPSEGSAIHAPPAVTAADSAAGSDRQAPDCRGTSFSSQEGPRCWYWCWWRGDVGIEIAYAGQREHGRWGFLNEERRVWEGGGRGLFVSRTC